MWNSIRNIFLAVALLSFIPLAATGQSEAADSWAQFEAEGGGTLKIYYYEEPLFAYKDSTGELTGIAIDVAREFIQYVEKTRDMDIEPQFIKKSPFPRFYNTVKNSDQAILGVGSVTITEERKQNIDFSPSFFVNKAVVLTHPDLPAVKNVQELASIISGKKMLVYEGTTQEDYFKDIKDNLQENIQMDYVQSDEAILQAVSTNKNIFGCVDLPVLIQAIKNGIDVRYQPKADIKGENFGFITPKNSGLKDVLNEFFKIGYGFKSSRVYSDIVSKHLGDNLDSFLKLAENPDLRN